MGPAEGRDHAASTKKQKKLLTFRAQPTGRELLANRAGGARQQHAHITFSSSITESPPFFLHPRRHVGQSDEDSTSPLHRGWRTKERTGDSTGSKSANEIHRSAQRSTNQRLPTRAGNVSAKGGSVCTCIVSKQQYGGVLLFRAVARPCRSSPFVARARRDHILPRRLRVTQGSQIIRSFAQNPVRSLQSDARKFPDRVTSLFGSDHESIKIDLGSIAI